MYLRISISGQYLLIAILVTIVIALVYATVQQSYRTAANDPQIEIAGNLGMKLSAGKAIANIYTPDTIDIAKSLSPAITFYDSARNPVRSTGFLRGEMYRLPAGLFEHAIKNGMHSVTWQPGKGIRMALVLVHVHAPIVEFVAVARSLREVETREYNLRIMAFIAWIACLILIAAFAALTSVKTIS